MTPSLNTFLEEKENKFDEIIFQLYFISGCLTALVYIGLLNLK